MATIAVKNQEPLHDVGRVHMLPISIKYTGAARVDKFFKVKEDSEVEGTLRAHFRGRLLRGSDQLLPNHYTGIIFRHQHHPGSYSDDEDEGDEGEGEDEDEDEDGCEDGHHLGRHRPRKTSWNVVGTFTSLTYWLREDAPNTNDYLHQWLHWTDLATALHQPLTLHQLDQQSFLLPDQKPIKESKHKGDGAEEVHKLTNKSPKKSPTKQTPKTTPEQKSLKKSPEGKMPEKKLPVKTTPEKLPQKTSSDKSPRRSPRNLTSEKESPKSSPRGKKDTDKKRKRSNEEELPHPKKSKK